jgi:hypothetical protein
MTAKPTIAGEIFTDSCQFLALSPHLRSHRFETSPNAPD